MFINPNNKFYIGGNTKYLKFLEELIQKGKTIRVLKGDSIITEGYNCDFFFYIVSGKFRTFRFIDDKEVTTGFSFKGDLDTCPYSFYNNLPSKDTIEALSHGVVIKIFKNQLEVLAQKQKLYHEFITYMQSTYIETLILRSIEFRIETAEKRYLKLLKIQPKEASEIPLQYLASFLGISKERLSRIRKKHAQLT